MALSPHTIIAIGWSGIFVASFFLYSNVHQHMSTKRREILRQRRDRAREEQLKQKELEMQTQTS